MTHLHAEMLRRHNAGQTARYIARMLSIEKQALRRVVRPLNQRGRLHDRHSRPGRAGW